MLDITFKHKVKIFHGSHPVVAEFVLHCFFPLLLRSCVQLLSVEFFLYLFLLVHSPSSTNLGLSWWVDLFHSSFLNLFISVLTSLISLFSSVLSCWYKVRQYFFFVAFFFFRSSCKSFDKLYLRWTTSVMLDLAIASFICFCNSSYAVFYVFTVVNSKVINLDFLLKSLQLVI